ncbi:hypothetical protein EC973_002039 [Apophysomyces ossiformis]|uniref:Uncharacterized protein n=1 Tax=Apophysomyces ossiformis TaxID=679940 RepID=A0A8H7BJL3_9FUNG|nr:hypothetical protein EC973_002039 [Apophysomyces ossiformis]
MRYTQEATPSDIVPFSDTIHSLESTDNDTKLLSYICEDVEAFALDLLTVLNLWGTKADVGALQEGLRRLVYKTYASPADGIFIPVWRAFASVVTQHPQLIWTVVTHCLHIMKTQPQLDEHVLSNKSEQERARIIFSRLSPMLILKVLPTEAFADLSISPKMAATVDWTRYDLRQDRVKISDQSNELSTELLKELLARTNEVVSFVQGREFAEGLIRKLYSTMQDP